MIRASFSKTHIGNIRLIILSSILFSFFLANAQSHYSSNVAIGVKGGMDFSRVFFNPSVEQKFATGYTAGIAIRYIEEAHFGIIGEVNIAQRGWTENFETAPYHYTRILNYVDIPIMAHIFFGRRGRFFFNAGPQIGIFLGESTKANFNPLEMNSLPNFPIRNRTNEQMLLDVSQKIDYGISAGLGGEFNINKRNSIAIEFRFYYGLGNIMPSKRADTFNASNQMTLSATFGYWFRIK